MMQADEPIETAELLTFVRTVEAGSISKAALALGLPRATVGRRLQRLEAHLGVRLLKRTTRVMLLTDAGESFYAQARAVLAAVRDAEASVKARSEGVRGLLRVSVPPMAGSGLGAMVADFLMKHPEVRVELEASSRHVDLVRGAFDVAIRASDQLAPGLVARTLGRSMRVVVGAPSYLAKHGRPTRARELMQHACLVGFAQGEHPETHWPRVKGPPVRVESVLASNDLAVLSAAAVAGRGLAMLPLLLVYEALQEGRLEPLLLDQVAAEAQVAVVFAEREYVSPVLRAFVDAVVRWAREEPMFTKTVPACKGHGPAASGRAQASRVARRTP